MRPLRFVLATTSLLALAAVSSAQAGASLFVGTTGHVFATYLGNSASYTNDLYLFSPANGLGIIFTNHTSTVGATVDLGTFTAGTELIFRLNVRNTGDDFYTGDASRNADNHAHAFVNFGFSPTETAVYFEDLLNGPYDYNDLSFSFTNVAATSSVPGPASAVAFAVMALRRRRKA